MTSKQAARVIGFTHFTRAPARRTCGCVHRSIADARTCDRAPWGVGLVIAGVHPSPVLGWIGTDGTVRELLTDEGAPWLLEADEGEGKAVG